MNKYSNYTDEELFKLWKEINWEIDYNRENGISDSSEYDLSQVGAELSKRLYILDEDEYNALDYYLEDSKLYDSGLYIQQDEFGRDYFIDEEENGKKISLKNGLEVVYESITDNIEEYPTEILNGLKKVFKRFLDKEI
ncbi:MAG: hypothetical protein IKC22_00655 [Bacilli bacterium]|nr:hypothetical protein [bacterium]MBR2890892.1 hypothetical protein [Bacilli bacterium]